MPAARKTLQRWWTPQPAEYDQRDLSSATMCTTTSTSRTAATRSPTLGKSGSTRTLDWLLLTARLINLDDTQFVSTKASRYACSPCCRAPLRWCDQLHELIKMGHAVEVKTPLLYYHHDDHLPAYIYSDQVTIQSLMTGTYKARGAHRRTHWRVVVSCHHIKAVRRYI